MLPSTSNRFSALSEEASDPTDVRLEMEELQGLDRETEETRISEVRGVSAGNTMNYLTASTFDLKVDRGPTAEEIQISSKATEMGMAPANVRASPTKGSESSPDEVTTLFGGDSSPLLVSYESVDKRTYVRQGQSECGQSSRRP